MTYAEIEQRLNGMGVLSPMSYLYQRGIIKHDKYANIPWRNEMIKRMLVNGVYLGYMIQGKQSRAYYKGEKPTYTSAEQWVIVEHTHEPIISQELFARIQQMCEITAKANAKPKGERTDYLLKGLIACQDCKKNLIRDLNGNFYYLRCRTKDPCNQYRLREDALIKAIFEAVSYQIKLAVDKKKLLDRIEKSKTMANRKGQANNQISELNKKIASITNFKESLSESYLSNLLTEKEFLYARQRYDDEIAASRQQVTVITKQANEEQHILSAKNKWMSELCKFKGKKYLTKEKKDCIIVKD